jgi:hypothetical protein
MRRDPANETANLIVSISDGKEDRSLLGSPNPDAEP